VHRGAVRRTCGGLGDLPADLMEQGHAAVRGAGGEQQLGCVLAAL
jgi:hypothetical protein